MKQTFAVAAVMALATAAEFGGFDLWDFDNNMQGFGRDFHGGRYTHEIDRNFSRSRYNDYHYHSHDDHDHDHSDHGIDHDELDDWMNDYHYHDYDYDHHHHDDDSGDEMNPDDGENDGGNVVIDLADLLARIEALEGQVGPLDDDLTTVEEGIVSLENKAVIGDLMLVNDI